MPNPAPTPYRAIQGFATYLVSLLLFSLYIFWALAPLEWLGFHLFPHKYLALSLPNVVTVLFVMIYYVFYPAINLAMTPDVDDMATVMDVKLLQFGSGSKDTIDWASIQRFENVQRSRCKRVAGEQTNNLENCQYCNEEHSELNYKRTIPTLYHIDLAEVNRLLYD